MNADQLTPLTCAWDNPFHPVQIAIYRRKTIAQKLEMVAEMHRFGVDMKKVGLRMRHPDWDEARIDAEARRAALYART